LLSGADPKYPAWRDYFDVAICSAGKPFFFDEGTTFREVDLATGKLKLGRQLRQFEPASKAVYQGGNLELFSQLTGANSSQVLYIGDHIFADITVSKKAVLWRTLLVVPEVADEVQKTDATIEMFNRLQNLYFMKNEIFRGLDANSITLPDVSALRNHIQETATELDKLYSKYWGSPFRHGSKQTHFSLQVERYADLYTGSFLNLHNYPFNYQFTPKMSFMEHETS